MRPHWDIFCRVIDNYGDIGVCWRLARQLAAEHRLAVRLWLDDLASLAPLCPHIDPRRNKQKVADVDVHFWPKDFPQTTPAQVVIEAFACELPANYLQAMCRCPAPPVWINLEYLSAEPWVEGCHALASPHPTLPLVKHFFFPGFGERTGGLLRENRLLGERDAFQAALPVSEALEISLFCYENAPVGALLETWARGERPIRCRVPPGQPLAAVKRHFGGDGPWQLDHLLVEPIPFLTQADYDRLLWSCDLNFVRGEDSFVRAQWAGRPFVWQAYPQQEEAHLIKLDAFLQRYLAGVPGTMARAVRDFFLAWNQGKQEEVAQHWPAFSALLPDLVVHGRLWAEGLNGQLAKNLVNFCSGKL